MERTEPIWFCFFCVAVYGENDESLEKQKIGCPNFQGIH